MRKDKSALPRQRKEVRLDAVGIDVLSQLLVEALQQADVDRKDIIRLRLAVEEILGLWQADAAQETVGVFRCGTRLGRMYIEISAPGRRIDPEQAAGDIAGQMLCANLLAQAGLAPTFPTMTGSTVWPSILPDHRRSALCCSCCWRSLLQGLWVRCFLLCPHMWGRWRAAWWILCLPR